MESMNLSGNAVNYHPRSFVVTLRAFTTHFYKCPLYCKGVEHDRRTDGREPGQVGSFKHLIRVKFVAKVRRSFGRDGI